MIYLFFLKRIVPRASNKSEAGSGTIVTTSSEKRAGILSGWNVPPKE